MNRIVLREEDFISLVSNNLTFKGISFSNENFRDLTSGNIVYVDNNAIILQDIGDWRILDILNKYKRN